MALRSHQGWPLLNYPGARALGSDPSSPPPSSLQLFLGPACGPSRESWAGGGGGGPPPPPPPAVLLVEKPRMRQWRGGPGRPARGLAPPPPPPPPPAPFFGPGWGPPGELRGGGGGECASAAPAPAVLLVEKPRMRQWRGGTGSHLHAHPWPGCQDGLC